MTSSDDLDRPRPTGLASIRYSIGNLWDEFGSTDAPLLGLVVNLGLAAIGVLVYSQASGAVAFVGAAWAILNVLGVVKWVFGL